MYGCDTGEMESLHLTKFTRIPDLSVQEAQDVGHALHTVRGFGHGTGEVCIPLVNGIFNQIRIAITHYRAKHKREKRS